MCGRFTLTSSDDQLRDLFQVFEIPERKKKFNIAPTDDVVIVVKGNKKQALSATWGLIPSWSKDRKIQPMTINARQETITEKRSFRDAFKHRRCLIPANGFYEWKKSGALKQPYLYSVDSDEPFAFAGIYEYWVDEIGKVLVSCSILTTTPNTLISELHNRMPVILEPNNYNTWLAEDYDQNQLLDLCTPLSSEKMRTYPVDPRMNNVSFESPISLERVEVQGDLFK